MVKQKIWNLKQPSVLFSLLAIAISLISVYLTIHPPIKEPNIRVFTNLENNTFDLGGTSFYIYVYNGGQAPCYDLQLEYPGFLSVSPVKIAYDTRPSLRGEDIIFKPPNLFASNWSGEYSTRNVEFIYDNEVIPFSASFSTSMFDVKEIHNISHFYIKAKCISVYWREQVINISVINQSAYKPVIQNLSDIFNSTELQNLYES